MKTFVLQTFANKETGCETRTSENETWQKQMRQQCAVTPELLVLARVNNYENLQ